MLGPMVWWRQKSRTRSRGHTCRELLRGRPARRLQYAQILLLRCVQEPRCAFRTRARCGLESVPQPQRHMPVAALLKCPREMRATNGLEVSEDVAHRS